ncbi:response regulator transcription factor [Clostridium sp. 'deep sea']|uniref:response regulator transcription factor n=1 Tax=Clostridium sp. 'deep sea' TaxID=2779445 RepID=UPI00189673E9|nr:response regulator transcription factor [Clostridium sp. 'deep sea']QOR35440.1 response regulator transcription factor [Clostridium sp. 'deep sea']
MSKILIVEDDRTTAMGIEYSLQSEGYSVVTATNCRSAFKEINNNRFSLILLDLNLPDGSGYEVCKKVRENSDTPVIFLTAVDEETNVVMGLDLGADDYITKPFRLRELLSRIKAILRRSQRGIENNIKINDVVIRADEGRVFKGATEIFLTALEYRLLLTMFSNKNKIFTRENLLASIWDVAGNYVNDNTLTVYIKRLREKIEDNPHNPQIIKTVRGMGYRVN